MADAAVIKIYLYIAVGDDGASFAPSNNLMQKMEFANFLFNSIQNETLRILSEKYGYWHIFMSKIFYF